MSNSKPVVLVVEGHPLVRACMVEALVEADFIAVHAGSAEEAVDILEARSDIGLVFTEAELPGAADELELARRIKDRWPPVGLIVATGRPGVEVGSLPAGTSVVPKPYHDAAVVKAMADLLSPEFPPTEKEPAVVV